MELSHLRLRALLFSFLLVVVASGCATPQHPIHKVDQVLERGDVSAADAILAGSESTYGAKSRVLYAMERGMTLHLAAKYRESNEFLERAERELEDLYTKRVRDQFTALLVNEAQLPYEGEHFEQVLVHVVMALNYARLGLFEDALVEARKIDHRLNVLSDRAKTTYAYTQDAFARYLTGMLYESQGELNDALIAYRLAHEAFKQYQMRYGTTVPRVIGEDLLRMSEALHLVDEFERYQKEFPHVQWDEKTEQRTDGELVVVSLHGRAPRKDNFFLDIPFSFDALRMILLTHGFDSHPQGRVVQGVLRGMTGDIVRVALPKFVPQKSRIGHAEVSINANGRHVNRRSVLMEDVTAIAEQDLKDRLVVDGIRAVARAAIKLALNKAARAGVVKATESQVLGELTDIVGGIVRTLTESADTRSWQTLPDEIHVTRLRLPPGRYTPQVNYLGRHGTVLDQHLLPSVEIKSGKTTFLTARTMK